MKTIITACALAALLVAGGCSNDQKTADVSSTSTGSVATASAADLTPEQLGELGAEIGKNPDDAEALLDRHGLDQGEFEQAIRKIAENPEASKRYAEAYRKKNA